MSTEVEHADADAVGPTRIALKAGAAVGPDEIDGFCENGAGVYLSAYEDSVQLTLYVVPPAQSVRFERSTLQLATGLDEEEGAELSEFESVTLESGDSRTFSALASGPLQEVVAEVEPHVTLSTP